MSDKIRRNKESIANFLDAAVISNQCERQKETEKKKMYLALGLDDQNPWKT